MADTDDDDLDLNPETPETNEVDDDALRIEGEEIPDDGETGEPEESEPEPEPEKPVKPKPSRAEKRIKELLAHNKALEARLHRIEQTTAERDSKAKFDVLTSRYESAVKAGDDDAIKEARQALAEYQPEQAPPPPDPDPQMSDAASDWLERNPWMRTDPAKAKIAVAVENMLVADGYSVDDPDLYKQLDKEMARRGKSSTTTSERRRPAGVGDARDPGSTNTGKPRLTQEDLQTMRLLGEDPNNPATRKAWLAQKQQGAR